MRKRDLKDKGRIQAAVRQVAEKYLRDPNVNSVGVGYKMAGGKRTDTIALQFTVGRKFAPQELEAVETQPIPQSLEANGITFQTDVLERNFERHPAAVSEDIKDERKRRLEPMMPGVSIGNVNSTAGTLGCVVKERASGDLRLLSNWHVFNGATGKLGDPIVQPGPYDDNRTKGNECGRLVRSFLGLAGDCAIASIVGRRISPEILELGVTVRRIGDAQLGDRVVKSGRTTAATFGLVTRIHTITKLDYDQQGEQEIGGFEIGPDDKHPAEHGEISMGGDSGSAWMAVSREGAAQDMMLGLHFAGETGEPTEFALACYASSVFEKLEIVPLDAPVEEVKAALQSVIAGFDLKFLPGHQLTLPAAADAAIEADFAPTKSGESVRNYMHYSLAMSASRRFCRWVAWNVDGSALKKLPRVGMSFKLDDAYEAKYQVGDELYTRPANALDRGHIARRADLVWGSEADAEQGNVDSFFFTNITPQLDTFNRSSSHGRWGEVENAIYEGVKVDHLRISVFGGPIFKDSDFPYRKVLVPRSFWKAIAYVENGDLRAKAYILTQDDLEARLESLGLEQFKLYQVSLATLAEATGLAFGALAAADTMAATTEAVAGPTVRLVRSSDDLIVD
jgi:endonuclease G